MKSIAFIIPYFGHFPNYFDKWLLSCKYNPTIDWILFTDSREEYDYPSNVHVNFCTFKSLAERVQSKFDFPISLEKPYKICDYRPAYGYIFSEELKNYDFWGYCDVDLIWGNFRKFVTDDLLEKYDRLGMRGHCSLLKNKKELNELFMKEVKGVPNFHKVFSSSLSFCFDEIYGFNKYFQEYNYIATKLPNVFDVNFKFKGFTPVSGLFVNQITPLSSFVYNSGELICYYMNEDENINMKELLYAHFQKRNMKSEVSVNTTHYSIIPNSFIAFNADRSSSYKNEMRDVRFEYYKLYYNLIVREIKGAQRFYHYNYPWIHKIWK